MKQPFRRAFRDSGIYAFAAVFEKGLGILLLPIYTFFLSPHDYGIYALLTLSGALATRVAMAPVVAALNRFFYRPEYASKQRELLGGLYWVCFLKAVCVGALWWFFSVTIGTRVLGDGAWVELVQIYTIVVFLEPFRDLGLQWLKLKHRSVTASLLEFVAALLGGIVAVGLLWFRDAGVSALVWGHVAVLTVSAAVSFAFVSAEAKWRVSLSVVRVPLKYGYPMLIAGYANMILQAGDRYVLASLSNAADVGLYNLGYQVGTVVMLLIGMPIRHGVAPVIFRLEESQDEQRHFVRTTATYTYIGGGWLVLVVCLFAQEAVALLASQEAYHAAWVVVPIIAYAYLLNAMATFFSVGLLMKDRSGLISLQVVTCAVLNIALNIWWIPIWGMRGAAWATLVAMVVWNAWRCVCSWRQYELTFEWLRLVSITCIGAGCWAGGWWLSSFCSSWASFTVRAVCGLAFPFVLMAVGLLSARSLVEATRLFRGTSPGNTDSGTNAP